MNNEQAKLSITSSPHILTKRTTRGIMLDVVIAMLPAAVMSVVYFGYRSAVLICVCVASCVVFEGLWCYFRKSPIMVKEISCVVTGMLIAFNLPAGFPIWQAIIGCFFAIIVVKQLFGGLGTNYVNPALAARVVLALSFSTSMTAYSFPFGEADAAAGASAAGATMAGATAGASVDAVASATPLSLMGANNVDGLTLWELFSGAHGGVLGETCAIALLAGGLYLVVRKVITPTIPVSYIAVTILFSWIFGCEYPIHAALSGGLVLGAVFMATDYTTSPYTEPGKLIFGVGCGLLTALIRSYGSSTEGVSYALLFMNLMVSFINDLVRRKPFGVGGKRNA